MEIIQLKVATAVSRFQWVDLSANQTQLRKKISEMESGSDENIQNTARRNKTDRKTAHKM